MHTSTALCDTLRCDECNIPIAKGDTYVELPAVYSIDTLWLHTACYDALMAGIDSWLCQEEERIVTQATDTINDDIPF